MYSKASTMPPLASCTWFRSISASSSDFIPRTAVTRAFAAGTSFSVAAVMTASVPSAPIRRSRRS